MTLRSALLPDRLGSVRALSPVSSVLARGTIVPTLLDSGSSTTDSTSFATASISPAANRLLLLAVTSAHGTAAETPNSVTGNGLTWTAVPSGAASNAGGTRRTSWFYASGAAPSAGAVSIGFAGTMTACAWSVLSVAGAALAAPLQATSNTANSTTVTGTLAALEDVANGHFYALNRTANEVSAPPASGGWSELSDGGWNTPTGAQEVAYAIGDTTADPTWTTSGQVAIVSIEVKAA